MLIQHGAMRGVGCSICPGPEGESNDMSKAPYFGENISTVNYNGTQMRKQWKWPWVLWLKLIPCQLVVRLIKTDVADVALLCLMENINNLVVLWNTLRHENKQKGSPVTSCWRCFCLFYFSPSLQCYLSPGILIQCTWEAVCWNVRLKVNSPDRWQGLLPSPGKVERKSASAQGDRTILQDRKRRPNKCQGNGQGRDTNRSWTSTHHQFVLRQRLDAVQESQRSAASDWGTPSTVH